MLGINRVTGILPNGNPTPGAEQARTEAKSAIGEVGHRVLSWVTASARSTESGRVAWATMAGSGSGFSPDAGELSRRGDVYDLRGLSSDIATRMGGTPAQEGALHRALEDFTRAAVVQTAGLSGASPERQTAGLRDALEQAGAMESDDGVDGVTSRIEAATATLVQQNGG